MSYTYESGEDLKRAILISPIFEKFCDGHHRKPQPLKTNSYELRAMIMLYCVYIHAAHRWQLCNLECSVWILLLWDVPFFFCCCEFLLLLSLIYLHIPLYLLKTSSQAALLYWCPRTTTIHQWTSLYTHVTLAIKLKEINQFNCVVYCCTCSM